MEIVALFDYRINPEQELDIRTYSFNSRFKVEYELDEKKNKSYIYIENNFDFIENFYSMNIDSFSVCVGENGSGKTRLLNDLVDINSNNLDNFNTNYLIIVKENNEFYFIEKFAVQFNHKVEFIIKGKNTVVKEIYNFRKNKTILISNSIEPNHKMKKYENFIDHSITGKLKRNSYQNIKNEIANNQVKFVLEDIIANPNESIISNFNISTQILIDNRNFDNSYHEYFKLYSLVFKKFDEKIKYLIDLNGNTEGDSVAYALNRQHFFTQYTQNNKMNDFAKSIELRNKFFDDEKTNDSKNYNEKKLIETQKKFQEYLNDEFVINFNLEGYKKYTKFILNLKEYSNIYRNYLEINVNKFVNHNEEVTEINREFISSNIFSYLDISWNSISSGENTLLTIFTDLSSSINGTKQDDRVLLLLDEIDIALHPDWQRVFLLSLFKYIRKNFKLTEIQIILTTHSPLILSDVRKDDVNFLTSNNSKISFKTFGANLNELMAESFFLKDGLMGEFSKTVIKNIIKEMHSKKRLTQKRINEIFMIIDEIGEVFIKTSLNTNMRALGYSRNKEDEGEKKRLEYLKNEIKIIEEKLALKGKSNEDYKI